MSNIFAKFQVDSQNIYRVIVIYKSVFLTFLDESPASAGMTFAGSPASSVSVSSAYLHTSNIIRVKLYLTQNGNVLLAYTNPTQPTLTRHSATLFLLARTCQSVPYILTDT